MMYTATAAQTKVTGLSAMNVRALRTAAEDYGLQVETTATTATFLNVDPAAALANLADVRDRMAADHGARRHPVASLPAVRRRLEAQLTDAEARDHADERDAKDDAVLAAYKAAGAKLNELRGEYLNGRDDLLPQVTAAEDEYTAARRAYLETGR